MFAVIVENDRSQWIDDTGVLYNFSKRYSGFLTPGAHVIYYKGRRAVFVLARPRLNTGLDCCAPSIHAHFSLHKAAKLNFGSVYDRVNLKLQ